jgi:hypothetical protein
MLPGGEACLSRDLSCERAGDPPVEGADGRVVSDGAQSLEERGEDELVVLQVFVFAETSPSKDERGLEGLDEEQRPEPMRVPSVRPEEREDDVLSLLPDVVARFLVSENALDVRESGEREVRMKVDSLRGVGDSLLSNRGVQNLGAA